MIHSWRRESDFQASVVKSAGQFGWLIYHTYDSRRSKEGFPDLVLVHASKTKVVFAELKMESGRPTEKQQIWIASLVAARRHVAVWRPHHWDKILSYLRTPNERALPGTYEPEEIYRSVF